MSILYSLSESTIKDYRAKVREMVGERKECAICDSVAKEQILRDPVSKHETIRTRGGTTLFYDVIARRYFLADIEKLRKAEARLNRRMAEGPVPYISLNEMYREIRLPLTDTGDNVGWNRAIGPIKFHFSSQLDENGTPCMVLGYDLAPDYDYICV